MVKKKLFAKWVVLLILVYLVAGCSPFLNQQPVETQRARLGPETPIKSNLLSLPEPQDQIVAAVYKFSDQTGQYKPSEMGSNWSTAVTQGATAILLRALEESGWFVVIERENLGNLLNERKIIRSSRAQYMGTDENNSPLLPPLLFAGIILEGGIISYEANIRTGGVGLRYFGTGGSGQYREDRVSIYLRAVSTSNGKVLKTVYTTKSILSQQVGFNLFKYVKQNALLEAEAGFTYNEPSEIAVTEAIEKAVISLVYEGIKDELWTLKNPADTTSSGYVQYMHEKEDNLNENEFGGYQSNDWRGRFGIGGNIGISEFSGDIDDKKEFNPFYELNLDYYFNPKWAVNFTIGRGDLATQEYFSTTNNFANLNIKYLLLPIRQFSPYFYGGAGGVFQDNYFNASTDYPQDPDKIYFKIQGGIGAELFLIKRLCLNINADYSYFLFRDEFDGLDVGKFNDYYWGVSFGVKYYFGKSPFYYQLKRNNQ